MTTTFAVHSKEDFMHQWRRRIGRRVYDGSEPEIRPLAVLGYRLRGRSVDRLVEPSRLTLVALYDERTSSGRVLTRFVGVGVAFDGNRLQLGGPELTRFDKDLRLPPGLDGRGPRLDRAGGARDWLALRLDGYLERCARHPYYPRRRTPRLPEVHFVGRTAYVDLTRFPRRQVIALADAALDLCGSVGATAYDFYHTRFHVAA